SDEEPLQDMFYRLSDESTYLRFMGFKRAHPHEEMLRLVDLDYVESMALVACAPEPRADEIIAIARYDVDPATQLADIAFVVRDDWQGKGIGTLLMRRMAEIGRARGLAGFEADVLAANKTMLSIFANSGLAVTSELQDGTYHLEARFPDAAPDPGG